MRCCRSLVKIFCRSLFLLLFAVSVQAAEISVRNPLLVAGDDGYTLSADFNINFNARLEESINKGIVLYFVTDFELTRSRWYWFDAQVIRRSRTIQLSYHALTRQYRLSTGALHQSFPTLSEALRTLSHLRNWQVLEKGEIKAEQPYLAGIRMRLDLTQMPRTFQIGAVTNKDWTLVSDWQQWSFSAGDAAMAASPSASGEVK